MTLLQKWLHRWVLVLALAASSACGTGSRLRPEDPGASLVTVRGLLSVPKPGHFQLLACNGNVRYSLGDMSAGNAHYLQRRFGELSRRKPGPVTVEVAGFVRKKGKGYEVDRPALVYIAPGSCVEAEEGGLDY